MLKPECFVTDNGFRAVVQEDPSLLHQSFAICVDTSQGPSADINYPHFLEHVLIRDSAQFDGLSYSQLVEKTANESNAATYPEAITFTLDCVPKAVKKLFPLLLQTLGEPMLSEETIERERTVIASEMRERAANPDTGVWERAWNNHGFTHTAVQEAASLGDVDYDRLRAYHERTFVPGNIFIVTAGPTPIAEIANYIDKSPLKPGAPNWQGIKQRDFTKPRQQIVSGDETTQTSHYIQVMNTTASLAESHVFSELNNSEREGSFWEKAINDIGVYSAGLYSIRYPYTVNARHYVATKGETDKIAKVHELGAATLAQWAEEPPTAEMLKHAKLFIRNKAIFKGEGSFGKGRPGYITSNIVEQLPQFPAIVSEASQIETIDHVTPEDIQRLAKTLNNAQRSYSLVGSEESVKNLSDRIS